MERYLSKFYEMIPDTHGHHLHYIIRNHFTAPKKIMYNIGYSSSFWSFFSSFFALATSHLDSVWLLLLLGVSPEGFVRQFHLFFYTLAVMCAFFGKEKV
jgi:hypothetical protein